MLSTFGVFVLSKVHFLSKSFFDIRELQKDVKLLVLVAITLLFPICQDLIVNISKIHLFSYECRFRCVLKHYIVMQR